MYTGIIDMKDDLNICLETIDAAYCLELTYLADKIQNSLTKNENLIQEHIVKASRTASKRDDLKILDDFCKKFAENSPEVIFAAKDFQDIDNETLVKLLERDIDLSEDIIWERVLQWGASKRADLRLDSVRDWSAADIDYMKEVLKDCIPLIRFFYIEENEYLEKVLPFLHLLPNQLWMDIVAFKQTGGQYKPISTVLPPRKRNIASSHRGPDVKEERTCDQNYTTLPSVSIAKLTIY